MIHFGLIITLKAGVDFSESCQCIGRVYGTGTREGK